jgi:hypothetical protein
MRLLILILITIVVQTVSAAAQDKELLKQLLNLSEKVDSVPVKPHHETGIEVGTSFTSNLKGGYGFDNYVSPHFSFQTSKSWKFDINTILGTVNYHNMTFWNYNHLFRGLTGNNNYFGLIGQGTYKVNDKLYLGSMVYIDKSLDKFNLMTGNPNGTNYSGSVFVGYKFSDKVSIQAGVSVQRYDNPWDINNSWINH